MSQEHLLKIIFAGTPIFQCPLKALIDSEHEVVAVYTQPDRPAGTGRKLTPSPVKAVHWSIISRYFSRKNFVWKKTRSWYWICQADLMVVVAYGIISATDCAGCTSPGLHQYSCFFIAKMARRGTYTTCHSGGGH